MRPGSSQCRRLAGVILSLALLLVSVRAQAQSPELSMRELASGQIKKGVRAIGFGGDGATWGNYGLVYRDANGALADVGVTGYTNGNLFSFTAAGATTPPLWHGPAIYVIALSQHAEGLHLSLSSPGLGSGPRPVIGGGADQAVFSNIAAPLGQSSPQGSCCRTNRRNSPRRRPSAIRRRALFTTPRGGARQEGAASLGSRGRGFWSALVRS